MYMFIKYIKEKNEDNEQLIISKIFLTTSQLHSFYSILLPSTRLCFKLS